MKNLSLTFDETSALLEMSVCSFAKPDEQAGASALTKLAYLYREFTEERKADRRPDERKLPRAA